MGTRSPWISRFLTDGGMRVTVANAHKLRAIYQNERKCDLLDARMLAKLMRVDPDLLKPIRHGSEQAQKDLVAIKIRDSLVRQRTNIVATVRGVLKSTGLRVPTCSTESFHLKAEAFLAQHPELEPAITPALVYLESLSSQIKFYDEAIGRDAHTP